MNIIILTFCYLYIAYLYIDHIFCIVYSLDQFVNEKVENKIKSNQIKLSLSIDCCNLDPIEEGSDPWHGLTMLFDVCSQLFCVYESVCVLLAWS